MPFYPARTPTICDDFYRPGIDYVYVPHTRSQGSYARLIRDMAQFGTLLIQPLMTCDLPVNRLLCHFYLPPCGNVTHFQPPTAVCPEQCRAITEQCPEEWAIALDYYARAGSIIEMEGLQLIDCNFPGELLAPLPYCCTDAGINISKYDSCLTMYVYVDNLSSQRWSSVLNHLA